MARNKSSHRQNIWNDKHQRFESKHINPTKAGRRKSRASLKRK